MSDIIKSKNIIVKVNYMSQVVTINGIDLGFETLLQITNPDPEKLVRFYRTSDALMFKVYDMRLIRQLCAEFPEIKPQQVQPASKMPELVKR